MTAKEFFQNRRFQIAFVLAVPVCFYLFLECAAGALRFMGYSFFHRDQYFGYDYPLRGRRTEWKGPMRIPTTLKDQAVGSPAPAAACKFEGIDHSYTEGYQNSSLNYAAVPNPGLWRESFIDRSTGQVIHESRYTINSSRYRKVPQDNLERRHRYAVFLGCSFVYGEGVDDEDTLPAQFAKVAPDFHVYNMAYHGYSPAALLARAQVEPTEKIVSEKEGIVIYSFIEDHMRRVVGTMRLTTGWGRNSPFFLNGWDGQIQQAKSFDLGRPVTQWVYRLLSRSQILQLFNIDIPFRYTERDWRFFAKLVAALREEYVRKLPNAKFYLVFHPIGYNYHLNKLGPYLDEYRIPYLVYRSEDLDRAAQAPLKVPFDCHPARETNRILAKQLTIDLPLEPGKNMP